MYGPKEIVTKITRFFYTIVTKYFCTLAHGSKLYHLDGLKPLASNGSKIKQKLGSREKSFLASCSSPWRSTFLDLSLRGGAMGPRGNFEGGKWRQAHALSQRLILGKLSVQRPSSGGLRTCLEDFTPPPRWPQSHVQN